VTGRGSWTSGNLMCIRSRPRGAGGERGQVMASHGRTWPSWLVHAVVYVLVAALLLVWALPVDWDTPTNLTYQEGWGSLAFVVAIASLTFGSVEGVLSARGVRVGSLLACLLGGAFAFVGLGFYLDGPIANGDQVWTAGREQVVMSQLVWAWYWAAQTLVAAAWRLGLRGRSRTRSPSRASSSVG
jgi:hypothetical protein